MVLRPESEPGSVLPTSPEAVETPEVVRVQEAALEPEQAAGITENVYEPYKPQRITIKGAQEHPTKLVQTAAMASVMPPDVAYTPKLPPALIKDGKLSAAQLEGITYAGYAHSMKLPPIEVARGADPVEFRRGFFIGDGTGPQPLDAKVLTPTGWVEMGRLRIGDPVIAVDGKPAAVIGVFPQGEREVYRVKFTDGAETEACGEHLWSTTDKQQRAFAKNGAGTEAYWNPKILSTNAIKSRLHRAHDTPIAEPIEFARSTLPLDPYLVGALLGDGSLRKSGGTQVIAADPDMLALVVSTLPAGVAAKKVPERDYHYNLIKANGGRSAPNRANPLATGLRIIGIYGLRAWEKHVPDQIKFNGPEERLACLQGLMDTDGYVDKRSIVVYTTVSERLAADVVFLVRSLGGIARLSTKPTKRRLAYNVTINVKTCPFRLPAKASRWHPHTKYPPRRYFESITEVGRKLVQCIRIDHPSHLYVTNDFIVTHNTGKGAQVAGIILDNFNQGRKKSLWLSESRTLINDARRDWQWLGRDPKDVFDVGKVAKPGADIKSGSGIGFLTYDTLKGYERQGKDSEGKAIKGKTRVDQIVDWLGKDFDGVIAFDESHNLANSTQVKGSRGVKDAAQKALAGIELQQKLPNARVVYVSATGATEVMNLAYAERLGLWGPGTAFPSKAEFINQISNGGVAAMELVARDMKALGLYISRNLSYDGVEYDRVEHTLSADQKRIYDDLAGGWQSVLQNMEAALLKTGAETDSHGDPVADRKQRTAAMSAFWSGHQRFFNQIITSMQMPSVIKGIERDLKEGKQSVLQLVNTNEASQERAISKARAEEGDLEDLDMTPRDQLMQMIEKSFPTVQREKYVDENGNELTRDVVDSAGNPVHNQEAVAMKDALLSKLGSIRVPDGPLEMLVNHFGTDKVAEITGRKQRVVPQMDEKGQSHKVIESRPGSANVTEAEAFQNAKKPVLVFSQAGMTGRSYHADLSSPSAEARRSHYLVQAGWRADKAIQGFGRTHRTNQASAPIFHLVTTDLQGQRRFISSIARRLAQLGALTKGERRAGESGMFSARDNLESPEAKAALGALWRDIQHAEIPSIEPAAFEQQTGLKLRDANGNSSEPPEITQFLNRLLSLKFDMQNHVFGEFESRLNTAVERAAAAGTLDVGTETLKADRITKEDDRIVHTDPQSGAETRYVRLKVENKSHPRQFDQVERGMRMFGGKPPDFYVRSKRSGKIMAVSESHDVTDTSSGRIVPQYRLTDPLKYTFTDRNKIDGYQADQYWERIDDRAQAKQLWDAQTAALPEYEVRQEHLITGAILPVWDRLKGWPTVYRLQTDAGEKLLGRTVHDSQIEATLKALGAEGTGRQYAPAEVAEQVLGGGRATLANGWNLRRSVVANEPRIELVGADYTHDAELRNAGVFTERIGYQTRYFVPTGEDAAAVLGRVLERRPVVELAQGRNGLAEESAEFTEPRQHLDRLAAYRDFAQSGEAGTDPHQTASLWLRGMGLVTGHEHLTGHEETGEVGHAYTMNHPSAVDFTPELIERLNDPDAGMVVHHNHPSGSMLSAPDLRQLWFPGLDTVVAHTHDGDISTARLTPEVKEWLGGEREGLDDAIQSASDAVKFRLQKAINSGMITKADADRISNDLTNRALDAAGVIDYMSSRSIEPLKDFWAKALIREAVERIHQYDAFAPPMPEDLDARVYRSTHALRPEEILGRLSGEPGEPAAGRPGRAAGEGQRAEDAGRGAGLAEETGSARNAVDAATEDAINQAVTRGRGPIRRVLDAFGVGRNSAGSGDYFFNPVNKEFTTPLGLARLDPDRSGVKDRVENDRRMSRDRYLHGYVETLDSFRNGAKADQDAVLRAAEVLTLEGRNVPADGRAVIVGNTEYPLARLSKVGDDLSLRTPERIKMFGDLSRTMERAWDDRIAAVAKLLGWEGEPTYGALMRAAEDAVGKEKGRLERAAAIIASVEYQRRTAYLPLMRRGDYFMRVVPKDGTPDRAGIPGWDGEGFAPTAWFELIDSRSPWEKFTGGKRSGTPGRATDAMAELRKTFPEGEYDIEHGYMFRKGDQIKDLPLPAVEKLMMLIGNDVRGEFERTMTGEAADAEYQGAVNSILKQVAGELKDLAGEQIRSARMAGPLRQRKGTAGYDGDFVESIGRYLNWGASSVAGLDHGQQIEQANLLIHGGTDSTGGFTPGHPDPQVQDFWRKWDRRNETPSGPLDQALVRARQGAFYWTIGGNAASALKNLLDGPMLGMPVLSTGMGSTGRARAYGDYIAAGTQLLKGVRVGKNGLDLDFMAGARTDAERAMLRDAEATGLIHNPGMDELTALTRKGQDALLPQQKFNRRVLDIWASAFGLTEKINRSTLLLAAHRLASREGMEKINQVWNKDGVWQNSEKTPEAFARFLVERSQGRWGIDNKTGFARTQLGGMLMQFRSFEQNMVSTIHQQLWHMGPEGKVTAMLMLGTMGTLAGALGLPFSQDIEKAYEWTHKLITGVDPNLEEKWLQFMKDDPLGLGANAGKTALHGLQPFGIDLGSVGVGNPLSRSQSALDMAGAAASIFLGAPHKAYQRAASGQSDLAAWAELAPNGIKNLVRAYGVYPDEGVRSISTGKTALRPQDISDYDKTLKAMGFRSKTEADAAYESERDYRLTEQQKQKAHALNVKIDGLFVSSMLAKNRGDTAEAARLNAEVTSVIQSAPAGIRPSMESIRNAMRQAINPQAAAVKAAPKAVRGQVAQPIYGQAQP